MGFEDVREDKSEGIVIAFNRLFLSNFLNIRMLVTRIGNKVAVDKTCCGDRTQWRHNGRGVFVVVLRREWSRTTWDEY